MAKKILLSQEFDSNIFTRNTMSAFFEKMNKKKEAEIVLDFKGVDFISRSCVDEYLKRKQVTKKKIIEVNMSDDVCMMFNAVQNQYKKAGFDISFSVCKAPSKKIIHA